MPPPIGASEAFITEDIRNVMRALLATHEAARRMMPETERMTAYSEGFTAGIRLLAEALNVNLGELRR